MRSISLVVVAAMFAMTACADGNPTGQPAKPDSSASFALTDAQASGTATPITSRIAADRCMGVAGGNKSNGTPIIIWNCTNGPSQSWQWQSNGSLKAYGSVCLTSNGTSGADGSAIVGSACTGGANQKWTATAAGEIRGLNSRCITVRRNNATPGTVLELRNCTGASGQKWDSQVTGAPAPAPVATVAVTPSSASLAVGASQQLTATMKDSTGTALSGRTVTWTTSNPQVATVSSTGLATAAGAGSATITATSEGKVGSSAITVTAPSPAPVASVSVSPASASIAVGATQQLTATTRDANGVTLSGRAISWSSSNAAVASVSSSGLVTGNAAGSATVTATSEGRNGSSAITVTAIAPPPPPPPSGTTIFTEGFESGNLNAWNDGVDASRHTVLTDASQAHSGSHVLRVTYPAGDEGGWLTRFFMPGYDSLKVSAWVYFPTNWTGDTRFIRLGGSRYDNQWSAVGVAGQCDTGTNFFSSAVFIDYANGVLNPIHFYTYYVGMVKESDGKTCYGRFGPGWNTAPTYANSQISKGQWHRIDMWMRVNTPGQSNGAQRIWLDGVLTTEWTGLVVRTNTDLRLNWAELSFRSQQSSSVARYLYVDDVTVTANASGQ